MLRVIVAPDGSLMLPEGSTEEFARIAASNTEDDVFDECIRRVGEQLSFPALDVDTTAIVQYPILFSPG